MFNFFLATSPAHAGWFDGAWTFRRTIDVTWDAEHAGGDELAYVEFYTAGHHKPNGEDIRVATDEGKLVASHVLMTGPGDRVRVVFALTKNIKKYAVYFGHPNPPPPPKALEDVTYRSGLLMEMKSISGAVRANDFKEIEATWNDAKNVIGRTFIPTAFIGINPFGEQRDTVSKLSGSLFAPLDGEYMFAAAADSRGALFIDGNPVVYAPNCPGDIRYNAKIMLTRGRHDFVFYLVAAGVDGRVSVGWRPPSGKTVEVIPRESFGIAYRGVVGGLEEARKGLTADFKMEYLGECFYDNHYTHRYRFSAIQPKAMAATAHEWLFGDAQTSTAKEVEHVFLTEGVYPVRLTMRIGSNSDTQTTGVVVSRDYDHITSPPTDQPLIQAKIVETYDVAKMPLAWLAWGATMEELANQPDVSINILKRMTAEAMLPDVDEAISALSATTRDLLSKGRAGDVMQLWDRIPPASNLQPRAVKEQAQFLLWWVADFDKAAKALEPFAKSNDRQLRRLYGQALVFSGQADKGAAILRDIEVEGEVERQVVMSGAMARTIEHYIDEGDWENGEETWEKWQSHYPADFLEGYSVLLRTRLIEARNDPTAAAKVAEAFARAVPKSSYSPQLLDRASKLLEKSDGKKSQELRAMLRKNYPEDPLSQ